MTTSMTATEVALCMQAEEDFRTRLNEARAATLAAIAAPILGALLTVIDPVETGELENAHGIALDRAELLLMQARERVERLEGVHAPAEGQ